jgi:hypothetical protein
MLHQDMGNHKCGFDEKCTIIHLLLKHITVLQLLRLFPAFYGGRKFITAVTTSSVGIATGYGQGGGRVAV